MNRRHGEYSAASYLQLLDIISMHSSECARVENSKFYSLICYDITNFSSTAEWICLPCTVGCRRGSIVSVRENQ